MHPTSDEHNRVLRVFLSSTFRDFMQERDLLVKEIFPELRRKARDRGVDVVDVDLRWGITEEESQQGKVIPICLGEIDRCRPYFIGMLGDRYGWIPPSDQYSAEVMERQPWLQQHLGGVSVTELEILHGVLNDPEMAGRAFFYFRDSAWSTAQNKPGFVCENAQEESLLDALKQRIRVSGFPVAEPLADPRAVADQIGADLWQLIEQQHPEQKELDGLAKEERKHASYRNSRLGLYLGGESYIETLETWIDSGHQSILITGDSGSGKSTLIANWMAAHQQTHSDDVVYAHHLGCSNDASALQPLLERLIETAKQQLPEIYGSSLSVPEDWWELIAKASDALQSLGRWAQQNNHRWILVLDGLDRLKSEDQNALPWLPLTIPEGVVIVASALDCPAREILLERRFTTLTIGPLHEQEQDALIQQYLGQYTKQLIAELRQMITTHPLGGSPLFLRVLLEELRQCGRYETLAVQLDGYLKAKAIDDLYELVLERLEASGNGGNVRKVMSALWASRAGLSEEELLAMTGLAPLQWAPIDLALEQAFGRNGNRLVFDHDYLRQAVEDRYLPSDGAKQQAHSDLADWFEAKEGWDERKAEELPWQLQKCKRLNTLKKILLSSNFLIVAHENVGVSEIWNYWRLLELNIGICTEKEYKSSRESWSMLKNESRLMPLLEIMCSLFMHGGKHGGFAVEIMKARVEYAAKKDLGINYLTQAMIDLSEMHRLRAEYDAALREINGALDLVSSSYEAKSVTDLYLIRGDILMCLNDFKGAQDSYKKAKNSCRSPKKDFCDVQLAWVQYTQGRYKEASMYLSDSYNNLALTLGKHHNWTTQASNNLALSVFNQGQIKRGLSVSQDSWYRTRGHLGPNHWASRLEQINHAWMLHAYGSIDKSGKYYDLAFHSFRTQLGEKHPLTALALYSKGWHATSKCDYELSDCFLNKSITILKEAHGDDHPDIAVPLELLCWNRVFSQPYFSAKELANRSISLVKKHYGNCHPNLILPIAALGASLIRESQGKEALSVIKNAKEIAKKTSFQRSLDFAQLLVCEANVNFVIGDFNRAEIALYNALEIRQESLPKGHHDIQFINSKLNKSKRAMSNFSNIDFTVIFHAKRFSGSSTM